MLKISLSTREIAKILELDMLSPEMEGQWERNVCEAIEI